MDTTVIDVILGRCDGHMGGGPLMRQGSMLVAFSEASPTSLSAARAAEFPGLVRHAGRSYSTSSLADIRKLPDSPMRRRRDGTSKKERRSQWTLVQADAQGTDSRRTEKKNRGGRIRGTTRRNWQREPPQNPSIARATRAQSSQRATRNRTCTRPAGSFNMTSRVIPRPCIGKKERHFLRSIENTSFKGTGLAETTSSTADAGNHLGPQLTQGAKLNPCRCQLRPLTTWTPP